jgi:hypothetical protein
VVDGSTPRPPKHRHHRLVFQDEIAQAFEHTLQAVIARSVTPRSSYQTAISAPA